LRIVLAAGRHIELLIRWNDLGTYSDAGIIFAEKPFVLVIMSKMPKKTKRKKFLPKITEAV